MPPSRTAKRIEAAEPVLPLSPTFNEDVYAVVRRIPEGQASVELLCIEPAHANTWVRRSRHTEILRSCWGGPRTRGSSARRSSTCREHSPRLTSPHRPPPLNTTSFPPHSSTRTLCHGTACSTRAASFRLAPEDFGRSCGKQSFYKPRESRSRTGRELGARMLGHLEVWTRSGSAVCTEAA